MWFILGMIVGFLVGQALASALKKKDEEDAKEEEDDDLDHLGGAGLGFH